MNGLNIVPIYSRSNIRSSTLMIVTFTLPHGYLSPYCLKEKRRESCAQLPETFTEQN